MHRRPMALPVFSPPEDTSAAELLSQIFRNAEVTQAILDRHMRVYLVHKECAKRGTVQPHLGSVTNYFSGKQLTFIFGADGSHPSPAEQRAKIARPLKLIRAAVWALSKRSPYNQLPGRKLLSLHHELPVHACSTVHWLPFEVARVISGCVATACHRLTTAPPSLNVYITRTKRRWEACVMARVVNGLVGKLQVPHMLFRAFSRLRKCTVRIFDAHCRKLSLCFWSEVPLYQQQYACPASFSHTPLLQASLFIKGQQDIFTASSNGDVNLVHSHLITDPSAVYKKNRRYDARCNLDCIL